MSSTFKALLFPLPKMVFFPTLRKPLNIFEPRYVEMINRSLDYEIPIIMGHGLIGHAPDTIEIHHESLPFIKRVAGCGQPRLIQKNPQDGSMLITLDPITKIEVIEVLDEGTPYNVVLCQEIIEFETVMPDKLLLLRRIEVEFRKWGKTYFRDESQYIQLLKVMEDPVNLISSFVEFVVDNPALKQAVLEANDINEKIDILCEWIV